MLTFQEIIDFYTHDGILHLMCRERKDILTKVLEIPFDPNIHYLIAYIHLYYAMLDEAKILLDHTVDKTDETYLQLEDYLNALIECERCNIGIFPLSVSHRQWWNGPHLFFPETYNDKELTVWFPLRIGRVEDKIAHVVIAKQDNEKIIYGDVELPAEKVGAIKFNSDEEIIDPMGEIAFYGDDYLIEFHKGDQWILPTELKAVFNKVKPIIDKSHNLLNEKIKEDFYGNR